MHAINAWLPLIVTRKYMYPKRSSDTHSRVLTDLNMVQKYLSFVSTKGTLSTDKLERDFQISKHYFISQREN